MTVGRPARRLALGFAFRPLHLQTSESGIWNPKPDILPAMLTLILASEAAALDPPGDDFQTVAYALLGLTMLVTAIATLIITPKAAKH